MSAVHQILITHCTHGSSVLERRDGEFAHRTLGYSARAGSVEAAQLRQFYRQVERYVYYYLPRDTPSEEKLRLDAITAPQRLVYLPSGDGAAMLAMVSYRQTDSEGRPGSYFAHALLHEEAAGQAGWSPLDGLRLWNANGWVCEDSPAIPFLLRPLTTLQELAQAAPAAIDEEVLLSFLTTPANKEFYDPGSEIAPRWRRKDVRQRQESFLQALSAMIAAASQPHAAVLLAIEPGMAALFFFGMLRLLPAALRRPVSFSTFEPNPERIVTSLAATWFHDPQRANLPADAMQGRGIVVSTLEQDADQRPSPASAYARLMLARLLQSGFTSVDSMLQTFLATGVASLADLERLAEAEPVIRWLLDASAPPVGNAWRQSRPAVAYLRRRLVQELAGRPDVVAALSPLRGLPQHLPLLELLAGLPDNVGMRAAFDFLLASLPDSQIPAMVLGGTLPGEAKIAILLRFIAAHGKMPVGCESLWNASGDGREANPPLMAHVLVRLTPEQIDRLQRSVASGYRSGLIATAVAAVRLGGSGRLALTAIVQSLDATAMLNLYQALGGEFFRQYPQDEPAMSQRLADVLAMLSGEPGQFSARLDMLVAGERLLPTDAAQETVTAWVRCRRAILEIGALQRSRGGLLRGQDSAALEKACHTMAEAVRGALLTEQGDDSSFGARCPQLLAQLGGVLIEGEPLLPRNVPQYDELWKKIAYCCDHGRWPSVSPRRVPAKKGRGRASAPPWTVAMIAVSIAVIAMASFYLSPWWPSDAPAGAPTRTAAQSPATPLKKTTKDDSPRTTAEGKVPAPPKSSPQRPPKGAPVQHAPVPKEASGEEELKIIPLADLVPREASPPGKDPDRDKARFSGGAQETPQPVAAESDAAWRDAMRRFVAGRHGAVVHQVKLDQGMYLIPPEVLAVVDDGARVCLGSGWVGLEGSVYPFGDGFEKLPPCSSHDLPQLAEKIGFASIEISVQSRADGFWLVATGTPRDVVTGGAKAASNALKKWKEARLKVSALLYQEGGSTSPNGPRAAQPAATSDEISAAIEGTFKVNPLEERYRGEIPFIGKLKFAAVTPVPKWVHDGFLVNVSVREYTDQGDLRTYQVIEVSKTKEHQILDGTTRIEFRYEFMARGKSVSAGATAWQAIETVKPGSVLSVKFDAPKDAWDAMRQ